MQDANGEFRDVGDSTSPLLCDLLSALGFVIPEEIHYCLASNYKYSIKYRVFGNKINLYIQEYDDRIGEYVKPFSNVIL